MLSWIAFTMPWICFYIIAYHPGALPESVEMVLFFIGLLLIASFMIPVYFGKKMALPVKVSRTSNSYTYTFYSGALKDFADQMDTGQGGS